jgi:F-type H+-transporting ATPase subunit b
MAPKEGMAVQQSGEHKVFPPLDPNTFAPQLIWLTIAFGLLYLFLWRHILPRVGEVIDERRERIKRDLAQAEKLKSATVVALANYKQALADARTEANDVVKVMRDKIADEADRERMKQGAEIAAKLAQAEKRIAEAKAKALTGLADVASDVAAAIVTRLIGEEVKKDKVERALMPQSEE